MNQEKAVQLSVVETQRLTELLETEQLAVAIFEFLAVYFRAEGVGAPAGVLRESLRRGVALLLVDFGHLSAFSGPAPGAPLTAPSPPVH